MHGFTLLQVLLAISFLSLGVIVFSIQGRVDIKNNQAELTVSRTIQMMQAAQNFFLQNKRWPGVHCSNGVSELSKDPHFYFGDSHQNGWGYHYETSCAFSYGAHQVFLIRQKVDRRWANYLLNAMPSTEISKSVDDTAVLVTWVVPPQSILGHLKINQSTWNQPLTISKPECPPSRQPSFFYHVQGFCIHEPINVSLNALGLVVEETDQWWRLVPRYRSYEEKIENDVVVVHVSDWKQNAVQNCQGSSPIVTWMAGCF